MAGKPSTKTERRARARRIRAAADRGETAEQIAGREALSTRQVRRVLASSDPLPVAVLDAPDVLAIDPFAELAACISTYREAITALRSVAARSRNDAMVIGASRSAAAASSALIELLGRVGVLPSQAFSWRNEDAWRQTWRVLGAALTDAGVDLTLFAEQLKQRVGRQAGTEVELLDLGPWFEAAA